MTDAQQTLKKWVDESSYIVFFGGAGELPKPPGQIQSL